MKKLFIILLIFIPLITVAESKTIDVCERDCSFSKIEDAINASSEGDTILLHPGTYIVYSQIYLRSVKIVGSGNETIVVPLFPFFVFDKVSLEKIAFRNTTTILAMDADNLSITNCYFEGNVKPIQIMGGSNYQIENNVFKSNNASAQIYIQDANSSRINGNLIFGGEKAIFILDSAYLEIEDNGFRDINSGITIANSYDVAVKNNSFSNCSKAVESLFSYSGVFRWNKVNCPLFISFDTSFRNSISENEVEGIYSIDLESDSDIYSFNNFNITGLNFRFSLIKPSLPENYVALSNAANITVIPDAYTEKGYIYMESTLNEDEAKELSSKVDPSTIAFYKLDSGIPQRVSESSLNANFTSKQSGIYILAAEKAKRIPGFELFLALLAIASLIAKARNKFL